MHSILVTGGCGFIGSNFIRCLLTESGFDGRVVNVDKLTYAGNPENLTDIAEKFPDRYVFVHADICDRSAMTDALRSFRDRRRLPLRRRVSRRSLDRNPGGFHQDQRGMARSRCWRSHGSAPTASCFFTM